MTSLAEQHTKLISTTLQQKLNLTPEHFDISEIESAKNNHVYLVQILARGSDQPWRATSSSKPYTSPIPEGTSRFVFRLPRSGMSLVDSVRIRNEVAFLALARDALSSFGRELVPRVYDWEDSETGSTPWIIQEWKHGVALNKDKFDAYSRESQEYVLGQVAEVVKCLQDFKLPDSTRKFGGLTFGLDGKLESTQSSIPCGGPFLTYGEFVHQMCLWQLKASERSSHLNGWKDMPKLRERLDTFFGEGGLKDVIDRIPNYEPCLVHADICFNNLLFNPDTLDLIAVLDFDFSHIGAPVSEFLFSFPDTGGILPCSVQPLGQLRKWILNGFPQRPDATARVPKAWDSALGNVGAKKPSNIEGAGHVADVWWFAQELCQAYWFMTDRFIAKRSPEALEKLKAGSARDLDRYLKLWGF